jgi:ribosomal protein S18 acetylase RimI-like enzyme
MKVPLHNLLSENESRDITWNIQSAHHKNQLGQYFSQIDRIEGATVLSSDTIKDWYWNYATQIDTTDFQIRGIIDSITDYYSQKQRTPCIYVAPSTNPPSIFQELEEKGFFPAMKDAWMVLEPTKNNIRRSSDVAILRVEDEKELEIFIKIFYEAYGGASRDEPYGRLPPGYGEALRHSFHHPSQDVTVNHFIGFMNTIPVGISTLIFSDGIAGMYNVGTSLQFRYQGVGTCMIHHAITEGRHHNNSVIYLLTEADSYAEKFYHHIGFRTLFIGIGYVLKKQV